MKNLLLVVLVVLPAVGWSQERKPAPAPSFSLSSESVRRIVLERARESAKPEADLTKPDLGQRLALKFRVNPRVDHVECDLLQCLAVAKDGEILYTVPRGQLHDLASDESSRLNAWLSCQDTNDLLSTFERYDRCRGINVGSPLQWDSDVSRVRTSK
jgi:hypothetical protein